MLKTNKAINNVNFECSKILGTNVFFILTYSTPDEAWKQGKTDKKGILELNVIHDPKSGTFVVCLTSVQKGLEMHHLKYKLKTPVGEILMSK